MRNALVAIVVAAALLLPGTAGASIVNVQTGTFATSTNGTLPLTLPAASTAGTLLVAVLSNPVSTQKKFTAPTGWTFAIQTAAACCGEVEIWYYVNNPGGITSASFTAATGTSYMAGQLTEWNGVVSSAPVDQTGTASHSAISSQAVSTSANDTTAGDLGVTIFNTSAAVTSFTPGTSWLHLFTDPTGTADVADYQIGLASGAKATETETATGGTPSWLADIVTFKPATCTGGSLTLGTPASVSFPGVTINGTNQTVSTTLSLDPSDLTGSGAGWNITGTSTTFTNASSKTLSTTATSFTAVATPTAGGNCVAPTSSITYPLTLPAAATAPTAVKLYNAAAGTGKGPANVDLTAQLSVPANAYNGTYTSTWTIAVVSGP